MDVEREARRAAQKAVIAQLGLDALSGMPVDELMALAVEQAARTLDVEYAKILELLPGGAALLMVAGWGWQEGLVGQATVEASGRWLAGYTMRSNEAVIVDDLAADTRFERPSLLVDHGVVSSISVIIHGRDGPFGVFGAHSKKRRRFAAADADFLQALANVVGTAIERRQAEDALRKSRQRLAVAIEASGAGIYEHTVPASGERYHSRRWAEILGYRQEELPAGDAFFDWLLGLVHPEDSTRQAEAFRAFVAGETRTYEVEVRLRHKTGRWIWVRSFAQALERDAEGRVQRLAGMMFDIDAHKAAQEERERLLTALRAATERLEERVAQRTQQLERRKEQLRATASSLTVAEQRERERISRILHDDLQQLLYAAQMQATMLHGDLVEEGHHTLLEYVHELERLHGEAVTVTRSLTAELSPPVLEGEGLGQALAWLANHMENTYGLTTTLTVEDGVAPERHDLRELLFQMVRELLFNVVKHAGVLEAEVTVRREQSRCVIEVRDEGRGFDWSTLRGQEVSGLGYGLRSMRERLALFDGTLAVDTEMGKGTSVCLEIGE